jgi:hypothetical protein
MRTTLASSNLAIYFLDLIVPERLLGFYKKRLDVS